MKRFVIFQDLEQVSYKEAWQYQQKLFDRAVEVKRHNRKHTEQLEQQHHLLFCEHPPVYTLGRKGKLDHLLLDEKGLADEGIEFFKINRGGDITYHGPGQLVAYPIFDLDHFFTDVHRYVRTLEEVVIRSLSDFGIEGQREKGYTGVWLAETDNKPKRKICAIGVHLSRWVSMHGFALNVNSNLSHFNHIVPCGIAAEDKTVTSMEKELGREVNMNEVKAAVKEQFSTLFELEYATTESQ
ncbi:MAG: lipoyl(octanoyl) transferase LipB [Bacteroidota bacterium]